MTEPQLPHEEPFRLRQRLADPHPLLAVELRPPRRDLDGVRAMEAWIDVYHAVHRLSTRDTVVFLTDNAIGTDEEENLAHLTKNMGTDAVRERIVPFLTLKHPLEYCLRYAVRARRERFPGLVVLGGDPHDGIERCLPRAWQLRKRLRREHPRMLLGGWANPYREPAEQVGFLLEHRDDLDFVLTQVVSHHELGPLQQLVRETERQRLDLPLFAGVFYYRSARSETLSRLQQFLPVPAAELARDFNERGLSADEVAGETLRRLIEIGLTRFYISNLATRSAASRLQRIARDSGLAPLRTEAKRRTI
ncbi:MAG: hypothetical protein JSV80_16155 [Acidobacteriota bacterium]|nr:MAG: hypothetical protein JSV80_16155 [Acidobacteriota bacterium]